MRDQQGVGRRRPERERYQARAATARVARQSTDAASARCTRAGPWRSRAGSTRRPARGGSTRRWSPRRALCCAAPSRRRTAARTRRAASPPAHPKHRTPIAVATRSAARIATARGSVCARWCQVGRPAGPEGVHEQVLRTDQSRTHRIEDSPRVSRLHSDNGPTNGCQAGSNRSTRLHPIRRSAGCGSRRN